MGEQQTSIIVRFAENSAAVGRRITRNVKGFTSSSGRHLKTLQRTARSVGNGLDRLGNRYTALLTGAAGIGTGRMIIQLEERFTRLGIQAKKSAEDIEGLKKKIYDTALAKDIRLDPGQITSAIEEIVEKTGDLEFAENNIRNIGLAIRATGAEGNAIGGILAEFQKMDIKDPDQVLKALEILNVQGKEGAFTLENLAKLGPRVVTAYTSTGRGGVQAIREMGAALQVIRQGTGTSEMAATAFEALLRTLQEKKKIEKLIGAGIQVFDPEELKKDREVLRPINELMKEIIVLSKGNKSLLSGVFDAEAMRAFNAAIGEYKRTGAVTSLESFLNVQANGTTTINDSARASKTAGAALRSLLTIWEKFADNKLTHPIQKMAETINGIDPSNLERALKVATGFAAALGGMILVNKTVKHTGKFINLLRRGKGAKGAGGVTDLLTGAAGNRPIPVYVVNKMPNMSLPGKGGKAGVAGRGAGMLSWLTGTRAGALGKLGNMGKAGGVLAGGVGSAGVVTTASGVLAAGAAGYGIGTLLNKYLLDGTAAQDKLGAVIAQLVAVIPVLGKEAKLAIEINTPKGVEAKATEMTATGMELDVDAGHVMIGS